jgi:hypothetical protein
MAKTKTAYLTMDWTRHNPDGSTESFKSGDPVDLPYETDTERFDFQALIEAGLFETTERKAAQVVQSRESTEQD